MKVVIVFAALFAVAVAGPVDVTIVRQSSDVQPDSFNFGVETSDGSAHDAQGRLVNAGSDHESIAVRGSYRFLGKDGQVYMVNYVADENGFQPEGAHLPVAPEA